MGNEMILTNSRGLKCLSMGQYSKSETYGISFHSENDYGIAV